MKAEEASGDLTLQGEVSLFIPPSVTAVGAADGGALHCGCSPREETVDEAEWADERLQRAAVAASVIHVSYMFHTCFIHVSYMFINLSYRLHLS